MRKNKRLFNKCQNKGRENSLKLYGGISDRRMTLQSR